MRGELINLEVNFYAGIRTDSPVPASTVRSAPSSIFFFTVLASTTKSPLTPSQPPAQGICEQIPSSQPPLRSFPVVFVFLLLIRLISFSFPRISQVSESHGNTNPPGSETHHHQH